MKKLEQKRKLNNGGFSLVELIIVIAIMAVLIGVLAPQYIKYVEKSRVSADGTTTDEFVNAMQVLASDADITLDSTKDYNVTSAANADSITISTELSSLFGTAGSIDTSKTYTYKSSAYKAAAIELKLTYDATAKVWKVTSSGVPN